MRTGNGHAHGSRCPYLNLPLKSKPRQKVHEWDRQPPNPGQDGSKLKEKQDTPIDNQDRTE